jgi:hypothetical protein
MYGWMTENHFMLTRGKQDVEIGRRPRNSIKKIQAGDSSLISQLAQTLLLALRVSGKEKSSFFAMELHSTGNAVHTTLF